MMACPCCGASWALSPGEAVAVVNTWLAYLDGMDVWRVPLAPAGRG
jgi:hypothetical protein